MKLQLTCCVCGGHAGCWEQHWNRDTDYGICAACAAEQAVRVSPDELASLYGAPGINYALPMVRYNGRRYRVLGVTKREDLANAFMARTEGAAVLTVTDDGTIIIADKDDSGEPVGG